MKTFLKESWFKILIIIIVCGCIFAGGYRWYRSGQTTAEKKQAETNQQLQAKDAADKAYEESLQEICKRPVSELTGIEFYRCKEIKCGSSSCTFLNEEKVEDLLSSPDLPTFCQRKISEMTANEFIECLEEPTDNTTSLLKI